MTRERLKRMDRLLRLRRLDEERDAARLAERARGHADARSQAAAAEDAVAMIGPWKARVGPQGGLDLGRYRLAIEVEGDAMARAQSAQDKVREAQAEVEAATADYLRSASQLRVSETRQSRIERAVRHEEEVRESDLLSDLLQASDWERPA